MHRIKPEAMQAEMLPHAGIGFHSVHSVHSVVKFRSFDHEYATEWRGTNKRSGDGSKSIALYQVHHSWAAGGSGIRVISGRKSGVFIRVYP